MSHIKQYIEPQDSKLHTFEEKLNNFEAMFKEHEFLLDRLQYVVFQKPIAHEFHE